MPRVLITAFEPYDRWKLNASWLALVELTKELPEQPEITTRLYPVDFSEVKQRLAKDLADRYDVALHLGQAPGASSVQIEAVGINVAQPASPDAEARPLVEDGPMAYRSQLPLAQWAKQLRRGGIPAEVSFHAGTFLCNAALYLSHHYARELACPTRSTFLHLPLAPVQVAEDSRPGPSMPPELSAAAIRLILGDLIEAV
ncbi:MAG: pyroglutamyl-peptidase I [Pirellulaceae bacterium]